MDWLSGLRHSGNTQAEPETHTDPLLAALPDAAALIGGDGRILDVNDGFTRLSGRTRAELVGTVPPYPWAPADGLDGWPRLLGRVIDEASGTQADVVSGPGRPVTVEARWARLPGAPGEASRHVLVLRDVSERQAALKALSLGEDRLQAVFAAMAEGLVFHRSDGRIVMANPAATRILGLSEDELLGRTSMDPRWRAVREDGTPFPGEEHPAMVTLRTGEPSRGTLMGVDSPAHGERRWIQIATEPVRDTHVLGGRTGVIATFTDVTALRSEQERYRAAIAATRDGMIVVGPDARVRSFNPAAARILGVGEADLIGADLGGLGGAVVDGSGRPVPRMRRPMLATLATGRPARGVVMGIDRPSDGMRVWVIESCEPLGVVDEYGRPAGALVTLTDITGLRRSEEALRANEQRYRALFGYHADAVLRFSPDGAVLDASPSIWRVLGLDPNDLPADWLGHVHAEDVPRAERAFARMAAGDVGVRFELRVLRGDGRWVWVEVTGGAVYDDTGTVIEVQHNIRDVTERVRRENDHAALERVSALIAAEAPAPEILAAVAAETAAALPAGAVTLLRIEGALGIPVGHRSAAPSPEQVDRAPPRRRPGRPTGRCCCPRCPTRAVRPGGPWRCPCGWGARCGASWSRRSARMIPTGSACVPPRSRGSPRWRPRPPAGGGARPAPRADHAAGGLPVPWVPRPDVVHPPGGLLADLVGERLSERVVAPRRQGGVPLGQVRPDEQALCALAKRLTHHGGQRAPGGVARPFAGEHALRERLQRVQAELLQALALRVREQLPAQQAQQRGGRQVVAVRREGVVDDRLQRAQVHRHP